MFKDLRRAFLYKAAVLLLSCKALGGYVVYIVPLTPGQYLSPPIRLPPGSGCTVNCLPCEPCTEGAMVFGPPGSCVRVCET